jgi:molecular chaperone GrpE
MSGKRDTNHDDTEHTGSDTSSEASEASQVTGVDDAASTADTRDRRVEELISQLEEANGRHLRAAADFENFKKRTRQERLDLLQYASAQLAEQLLPVLDDFERALAHAPEGVDEMWLKGMRMAVEKLHEVLAGVGVEPIQSVGNRFDPKLHEAIATEESEEHPEDTVLDEVRRGYRMHDRVLRPALVRIARLPSKRE